MSEILIPARIFSSEFVEKKSKFISLLYPVADDKEVKGILKELRSAHAEANHVVWSYVLGDAGTLHGLSDDGEPHGTAGRPVLEVLKGSGLTYAALFVIRYFGGTKLGTGGLVSAYTKAAQDVLAVSESIEKIDRVPVLLECNYNQYERIKSLLTEHDLTEVREEFGSVILMEGMLPEREFDACSVEIKDYTNASVELLDARQI